MDPLLAVEHYAMLDRLQTGVYWNKVSADELKILHLLCDDYDLAGSREDIESYLCLINEKGKAVLSAYHQKQQEQKDREAKEAADRAEQAENAKKQRRHDVRIVLLSVLLSTIASLCTSHLKAIADFFRSLFS